MRLLDAGMVGLAVLLTTAAAAQDRSESAPSSDPSTVECAYSAFTEADRQFFGDVYAAARVEHPDKAPVGGRRLLDRLPPLMKACRRRHGLSAGQAELVFVYAIAAAMRDGAARHLIAAGVDPARLDPLARRLSFEQAAGDSDPALLASLKPVFDEAAVPAGVHKLAADYLIFLRRSEAFRIMWSRGPTAPPR